MIEKNIKLVEKYPFLKFEDDCEYTWLDDLELGWRIAFGEKLCEELDKAIKKDNCEDTFEFLQIKEKFGALRLYATGYEYNGEVDNVLSKYEELSRYICAHCGKPATKITKGWIFPLCDNCIKDVNGGYSNIEDFYDFDSYEDVLKEIEDIKTNFDKSRYCKKV